VKVLEVELTHLVLLTLVGEGWGGLHWRVEGMEE